MSTDPINIPLKGVRGMVADHMVASLATAAQLTHHASANVQLLLREKARLAAMENRVSVEDLLIYATLNALKKHPDANGRVDERSISIFKQIDLSVAVSLPGNLLVAPSIFGAGDKNIVELSEARKDLAQRARNNKVSVEEMRGGTFTVSNLGLTRVEHFTPIINLPQICILGFGATTERAVRSTDGDVEFYPFIHLSLTFDHRALDGEPAGQFLTTVCEQIETIKNVPL